MLVELAIGDAYGAGFEFTSAQKRKDKKLKNDLSQYYPHNLPGHLPAGSYTDDTQMSLAVAETLLQHKNDVLNEMPWNDDVLSMAFFNAYSRDPRNGYSRKMQNILEKARNGKQFKNLLIPNSDRCGAAMRACPIGLLADPVQVWEYAAVQARVTHNTLEGIVGAVSVALAVYHQYHHLGDIKEMPVWVAKFLNEKEVWTHKFLAPKTADSSAKEVVSAAFWAVTNLNKRSNMRDLLISCNNIIGDVDSISAIAMGIASVSDQWSNNLPKNLYDGLENGPYGLEYLKVLDRKLMENFPR